MTPPKNQAEHQENVVSQILDMDISDHDKFILLSLHIHQIDELIGQLSRAREHTRMEKDRHFELAYKDEIENFDVLNRCTFAFGVKHDDYICPHKEDAHTCCLDTK